MTASPGGKERPIKILLLGPPEIYINNKPVVIKRRLNRALLFYLSAQLHPVARSEVCEMFWPREDEEKGRKNLREALSRLRQEVGIPNLIVASGDYLSLEPSLIEVDLLIYQRIIIPLLSSAEFNTTGSLPDWVMQDLKKALALCRGFMLMQGFVLTEAAGFEDWLGYHNQSYNVSRLKALDRLIDHYISSGNLDEAIVWIGVALKSESLDEELNFLMLICLRDMGRIDEMLEFAKYTEGVFKRAGEPIPEKITDLKNQALRGHDHTGKSDSRWPTTEREAPDFVGREYELDTLNKALRSRGVVLLSGEAGIGKTRLLKQFFTQQAFPPRLIYCAGHPLASKVAFRVIVNAVRTQIHDEEWYGLPEAERQMLNHFYHGVLQGGNEPGLPTAETEWLPVLENVFFAFMHLLEVVAARRPLLFILDDAMWADQASVSLLSFLIEHGFFDRYGLLVIAVSPDVVNKHLDVVLQRERRARKLITIQMTPYTNAEIERFVEKALGRVPGNEDVDLLQRLTGGNPYFLSECVRSAIWITTGNQVSFPEQDFIPPDSIASLMRDKVNGLEPESVQVLKAAAILGRKFCSDVVEEMVGMNSEQLAVCLEELTNEGFMKVNHEIHPLGGFEFKHDIEREIVLAGLSPAIKRDLHLKAARALVRRRKGIPSFSAALAQHYEASLQQRESLTAWLEAGRYARSQYLLEETHQAYGNALQLIKRIPAHFDEAKILQVINEWGNFAHDRDDTKTGRYIYQTCLEIGHAINSPLLIGAGHSGLGRVADFEYDYQTAVNSFQSALFYLSGEEHAVERVKALARLGIMQFGMDDYTQAYKLLGEALSLDPGGKDHDSIENRVNILSYLCFLDIFKGDPSQAKESAEETARLSILLKRKSARVQAHGLLAMTQYFNNQVQLALHTCQEYMDLAENLQVRFWWSLLDNVSALTYHYTGNLDQSWFAADRAYQREKNYPLEKLFMQSVKIKGDIYRSLEDYPRAREYYLQLQNSGVNSYQTIGAQQALATILIYEGKKEEALESLDNVLSIARLKGVGGTELNTRLYKLLLSIDAMPADAVEREGNEIQAELVRRQMLDARISEYLIPGHLAEVNRDLLKALKIYNEMEEYLFSTGNVWMELKALRRIISLSRSADIDAGAAVARTNDLLIHLGKNATHPAIKGSFIKFRNKWKRYVNAVSTH